MRKIFNTLCSKNVVLGSGFMIGFIYDFKLNEKTLEYPLSTIGNASISGFMTYLGAHILHDLLPLPARVVIPITAGASCVYYKYNDIFKNQQNEKD